MGALYLCMDPWGCASFIISSEVVFHEAKIDQKAPWGRLRIGKGQKLKKNMVGPVGLEPTTSPL